MPESLATVLSGLTALTYLDLRLRPDVEAAHLTPVWEALGQSLYKLTCLLHFVFKSNFPDERLKYISPSIGSLNALEALKIVSARVHDMGVVALCTSLAGVKKLKELHLCVDSIGDEGASSFISALEQLPDLSRLHVRFYQRQVAYLEALMRFLH